jgi:cytochrome c biogenesis protein CcmG, thiol:disulfide interchange protein DsbE
VSNVERFMASGMKPRKSLRKTAVIVTAVVLGGLLWANRARFLPLDVGSRAPSYSLYTLDGDTVDLAQYRGDVVVLNVWATWCGPCVKEIPALQRLYEKLGSEGLRIVAVSVDSPPGILGPMGQLSSDVRQFADGFGVTFDVLYDPSGDIQRAYQVSGLPTTFLIDRDGRIRKRVLGAREWDDEELVRELRELLAAAT